MSDPTSTLATGGDDEKAAESTGAQAASEQPTTEQLQEPSTEKEPGEEPKAEKPHDPEPSHQAVGIGVVGGPQSLPEDEVQEEAEAEEDGGAGGT
ncbi:hypothetical protein [Microbacterium sp. YJN-G]|uniref:hypothetical protein n=1 Tax=Microbacterium sp. YJN-G TaxID=2763257 RepID=UPI001D0CA79D|nr:hypothetical protein [Microbacterium sp. YJN-G]